MNELQAMSKKRPFLPLLLCLLPVHVVYIDEELFLMKLSHMLMKLCPQSIHWALMLKLDRL